MRLWCSVAILALLAAGGPLAQTAPSQSAAIEGRVTDAGGGALPGVTITISRRGVDEWQTLTDADGRYRTGELAPGPHILTASLDGFQTTSLELVLATSGAPEPVDLTLPVACLIEESHVAMPVEYLLRNFDLSARLRIISVGQPREWPRRPGCPFTAREFVATRDDVLQTKDGRSAAATVAFLGGPGLRLAIGDEALVFGWWAPAAQRFISDEHSVAMIRGGRVTSDHPSFDELDGLSADQAVRILRHVARFPEPAAAGPLRFDDLTVPPDRQLAECALSGTPWVGNDPAEVRRTFERLFPAAAIDNDEPGPLPDTSAVVEAYAAEYRHAGGVVTEVLAVRFREPAQTEARWPLRHLTGFGAIKVDTIIAGVIGPPSPCLPVAAAHLRSLQP